MRSVAALALTSVLACTEPTPPASVAEPATTPPVEAPAAAAPAIEAPSPPEPTAPEPAAPAPSAPSEPPEEPSGDLLAAIEPLLAEEAGGPAGPGVEIVAEIDRGSMRHLLVAIDLEALFYARLAARDGDDVADALAERRNGFGFDDGEEDRIESEIAPFFVATGIEGAAEAASGSARGETLLRWDVVSVRRTGDDDQPLYAVEHRRTIVPSGFSGSLGEDRCTAETELRARDVDGDGSTELVAIVTAYRVEYDDGAVAGFECVSRAEILRDDLTPQLSLERERRVVRADVWTEIDDHVERLFRFGDADGDGHADVHLVRRASGRSYDAPDGCEPDEPVTPEHEETTSHRAEWDCPYDAAADVWRCPPEAELETPPR